MPRHSLTVGVARTDITPPLGFRMQGAMRRTEGASGAQSPLLATCLVLADEDRRLAIVDCDLIGFDVPLADEIRKRIGDGIGVPAPNVILGCTHTHNGPCTFRGALGGVHDVGGEAWEIAALDAYIDNLRAQLVGIAKLADRGRRPARARAGEGRARVGINREEVDANGRTFVGRNPEGPSDHAVPVLRIDDLEGAPIAVLTGYAAHPVVMGYETFDYTPDYPGVVRRVVEQVTGATCLFLTGAAGNQAALSFLQSDWGEMERMGGQIGAAAVQAFYEIETRPGETVRRVGKSLSDVAHYYKTFVDDGPTHDVLSFATRPVTVPLKPLPDRGEAERQLCDAEKRLGELRRAGAPRTKVYPQMLVERWARGVHEKVRSGLEREELTIEVQGFRLDDFALLAMPGEPFVEIGLEAKRRSSAAVTLFAGYCNGLVAYWPTPRTLQQGGMAAASAVKTYNNSAPPETDAVRRIVGGFEQVLSDLGLRI